MNTLSVNKTLILNYFAGNASPMQKRLIRDWLSSEENQEQYFEWLQEWQSQSPQYLLNGEKRFTDFVRFMEENPPLAINPAPSDHVNPTEKGPSIRQFWKRPWMMAAASVLLVGFMAWFGRDKIYYRTYQTNFGETETVHLSDGTKVILNANTSMTVPRFGFGNKMREVLLDGEAFFVVKHTTDNKKFLVKTGKNFEVLVLGTEFSVYTRSTGSKVLLKKGKVQVRFPKGYKTRELVMKPGELVTMDKSARLKTLKTHADTQKLIAWTSNRFIFDKTPLSEVADLMREHFGVAIEIQDPKFATRTVSGTFQPDSAEELLSILSEMFDFKLGHEGDTITIGNK